MSVNGNNSGCLIDWSTPEVPSFGKPLIPVPPMLNNTLESVDDNNPFDAIERQLTKDDPLEMFNVESSSLTNSFIDKCSEFTILNNTNVEKLIIEERLGIQINISEHESSLLNSLVDDEAVIKEFVAKRINRCIEGAIKKVADNEKAASVAQIESILNDLSVSVSPDVLERWQYKTRLSPTEKLTINNYSHMSICSNNFLNTGFALSGTKSTDSGFTGVSSSYENIRSYPSSPLSAILPSLPLNQSKHNTSMPEFPTNTIFATPNRHNLSISVKEAKFFRKSLDSKIDYNSPNFLDGDIDCEIPNLVLSDSSSEDESKVDNDVFYQSRKRSTSLRSAEEMFPNRCPEKKLLRVPFPPVTMQTDNEFRIRKCDTTTVVGNSLRGPLKATVKVQDMAKNSAIKGSTGNYRNSGYSLITPKNNVAKRSFSKPLKPVAASTPSMGVRRSLPPKINLAVEQKRSVGINRAVSASRVRALSPDSTSDSIRENSIQSSPVSRLSRSSYLQKRSLPIVEKSRIQNRNTAIKGTTARKSISFESKSDGIKSACAANSKISVLKVNQPQRSGRFSLKQRIDKENIH